MTVSGQTNQTDTLVGTTGEEDLITPVSGQARVEAEDGAFTIATIAPINPGLPFSALSFQVNPTDPSGGTLTLEVVALSGIGLASMGLVVLLRRRARGAGV